MLAGPKRGFNPGLGGVFAAGQFHQNVDFGMGGHGQGIGGFEAMRILNPRQRALAAGASRGHAKVETQLFGEEALVAPQKLDKPLSHRA
jgi:hypothetical protein